MKSNKLTTFIIIILAILAISVINSNITGYAVADITGEFPGLGIFIVILLGVMGLLLVKDIHNKK